jgi:hypothetical protein
MQPRNLRHEVADVLPAAAIQQNMGSAGLELALRVDRQRHVQARDMALDPTLELIKPVMHDADRLIGVDSRERQELSERGSVAATKSATGIDRDEIDSTYFVPACGIREEFGDIVDIRTRGLSANQQMQNSLLNLARISSTSSLAC